ncbi:hypothetical protein GOP47_0021429 [Adiantum capillus-veneris]|uniref:Nucleolar pre-ribosomal-associated protein 1 n=1 Tax=Adiantum capillus-veneris TaxID=13818 RepID=A0A9D4U7R0_ADICA|nr:hypothetical protein GOP47_0021429 [Adiantum capillus-veneris]
MDELGSPSSKRLRLSSSSTQEIAEELQFDSSGDVEAKEWRETRQSEAKEQVKEDAELEVKLSGRMRLEDLDERIKNALTGITSKHPREALVAFRQLLQGDDGGNLLCQYVLLSPKCTEIVSIWSSESGKEYAVPLLQLFEELLKHPVGKMDESLLTDPSRQLLQVVRLRLDKVARLIISTKLKDIYANLTSGERSRQCAALHLLASIVKRGNMLASEVAITFDFNLNVLPNLARPPKPKKREVQSSHKWSTRSAFIDFAISFLEVCQAALLRWVLQIRPLYGGVLHKLANDDESTIIHVLKVFQLKVLDASAMVPAGLQSAVFGDSALEQMAAISSDVLRPEAAGVAHDILLQLCTDASHGICPEPALVWGATSGKAGNFGGGHGRLVRLMVKLRATEVQNHRDLLLSIAAKRPTLVANYFDFFPYSLEPRDTNSWFAAAALISDIILVSQAAPPLEPLATQGLPPPTIDSPLPQAILRSALPRTLTRLTINRGLLHANMLVKHVCLRMLSEVLSAGEFYLCSINKAQTTFQQKFDIGESRLDAITTKSEGGLDACVDMETLRFDSNPDDLEPHDCEELDAHHKWLEFGKHFENELRSVLPDPQVLFSLLSLKPSSSDDPSGIKGTKGSLEAGRNDEPMVNMERDDSHASGVDNREEDLVTLTESGEAKLVDVWNADENLVQSGELEDVGGFLNAKLLEVLATYQGIMPMAIVDSSFDVFKLMPDDPDCLTLSQQKALLKLLLAASGNPCRRGAGFRPRVGFENLHSRHLYRYLKPILKFTLGSRIKWIKQQWQLLAYRAMICCGAFENNSSEIGVWLQFLPFCDNVVLSFLCDAVETVGRNVDKYVDTLVSIIHSNSKQENQFAVLQFGPLVVCILDKCLRVLASASKNLKIFQRTSVCIYVANALSLLLQSQVHPQILSLVLDALLSSRLEGSSADTTGFRSEWTPLQNLLLYARWHQKRDEISFMNADFFQLQSGSLAKALKVCTGDTTSSPEAKALALSSCLQCVPPQELADNFPLLMEIFFSVFKGRLPVLVGLCGAYRSLLSAISKLWPEFLKEALLSASGLAHSMHGTESMNALPERARLPLSSHGRPENDDTLSAGVSNIPSFAFSVFLLGLPFAVIFPALASSHEVELWGSPHLQSILQVALSEVSPRLWLCTANLILYWVENFWELQCKKFLTTKCQLEVCFSLLKLMILPAEKHGWLALLQADVDTSTELDVIVEFLQGVLTHPVMNAQFEAAKYPSPTAPSDCDEGKTMIDELLVPQVVEQWFQKGACGLSLHLTHTVAIFKELLQWAAEPPSRDYPGAFQKDCQSLQRVVLSSCKPFLSEVFLAAKTAVAKTEQAGRFFPNVPVYLAFTFSSYIDINLLAELSCTLLSEELTEKVINLGTSSVSMPCHTVGLYFTTLTFKRVASLLQRGNLQQIAMPQQILLQNLYQKVLHIVLKTPFDMAFSCLYSGLEAHGSYGYLSSDEWAETSSAAVPLGYIYKTPLELLAHLMTGINKTKAKIILHLIQSSQCYLAVFAEALLCNLGVTNLPLLRLAPLVSGPLLPQPLRANAEYTFQDKILLLPSVNWLVNVIMGQGQMTSFKAVQQILSFYSMIVVEILKDWNIFGTGLDMAELSPFLESKEHYDNFIRLFGSTTPGQVVLIFKHCLASHLFSAAEKENFFSVMVEKSYPLLDLSVGHIDGLSVEATLKLISVITAKSMLAKFLLLSDIHEANTGSIQSVADRSKTSEVIMVFISTLCALFDQKFSESSQDKDGVLEVTGVQISLSKHKLLQVLERNLLENLRSILNATVSVQLEAQHMSALKKFTKFVLRYRYGQSLPMQVLRLYAFRMVHVPDFCRRYAAYGFNLLVGHSQFASTLLSPGVNVGIGSYSGNDFNSKSLSSILSVLKTPTTQSVMSKSMSGADSKKTGDPKLELLKFLRLLYYLKQQSATFDTSMEQTVDSIELLSLLLAAYGASLSKTDKENLLLMQDMESVEGASFCGLVGMDYLWGGAALKWRQINKKVEHGADATRFSDKDTSREARKRCFKEGVPLDPTKCALSILFFPLQRSVSRTMMLDGSEKEEKQSDPESAERLLHDAGYDPCFILPFALHSLSSGWIDANEFVQKGLLAIALMSTASAEEDMRKLGYEILAKFLTVLEECPSFKGKPQIKLLLVFVKNSVLEPWQRMPSVAALFAAEASCILMTPSDVHYPIINKILFRTTCLDLETIPLFKPMFGSGTVYFRADRSWILRLLAFGLRTSFDTHVYRRRFILEILMSFYGSPLGDRYTREWILQILYRASKLRSFAQYLVEHCGLLSWLTTIFCSNGTAKSGEYAGGISTEIAFQALQIFENTLQWRSIKRWLISEGFEELSKMVMLLHYALVETSSFGEPAMVIKPYLRIIGTAFQLSQVRRKFQSHCNFSLAEILALVHFAETEKACTHETRILALRTILECQPPACHSIQDRFLLWKMGMWSLSLALRDFYNLPYALDNNGNANVEESSTIMGNSKDLITMVLQWVTASLILGESDKAILQGPPTAWTFFCGTTRTEDCGSASESDINKSLLKLLIHQQSMLGTAGTNASAVCAALLLLPSIEGSCGTFMKDFQDFIEWPLRQLSPPCELEASWRWRPSQTMPRQSSFEYETCQLLFALFQRMLFIKESSELHNMVEQLQLGLLSLVKRQDTCHSAHVVPTSVELWKHLKKLFQLADNNGQRTGECGIKT